MSRAIALAEKGRGFTSPNPMVGAVVVKDGRIVGEGWHKGPGLAHAEVNAIDDAGKEAEGADIYVTLEPCNHFGRTPPCTRKILDAGICRVFVSVVDPNPFVKGGGIEFLREKGITVETGVCQQAGETLIEDFIWFVKNQKRPFVILKCASTLDGRIATRTGDSRWITNEKSRAHVHLLRHRVDAILIGSGTLHADNPSLTSRVDGMETRDPRRVVLDSHLSIDPDALVITGPSNADTIVMTALDAPSHKKKILETRGVTVVAVPRCPVSGGLDLAAVMGILGKMNIMSVLIEGGGTVVGSALAAGVVNKVMFFLAPKILGGDDGVSVCRGKGPSLMKDSFSLKRVDMVPFDDDILIQGYLN
ncbi:diaminohydroxyphosphoribosylaminopyrimidine deaminase / 5-amino-6-(5-phosphoribosylamino)uracil reductase [Desulfocicer vacuolatum DSM 3385]|uniref:Riboflavin biosynthesis protein RibD n=2 Tax=Desulfocicer vacuolatum TaxID=2298 RepID=A0A1W2C2V6_9BACT|nr:diaminohydroxyphosphoribosylaminopyrimidine deaminase / 5-amino-6-(5-phosphoribosylamino)uracil reductase [Desulfocicer vacuolatum DSM 3385]